MSHLVDIAEDFVFNDMDEMEYEEEDISEHDMFSEIIIRKPKEHIYLFYNTYDYDESYYTLYIDNLMIRWFYGSIYAYIKKSKVAFFSLNQVIPLSEILNIVETPKNLAFHPEIVDISFYNIYNNDLIVEIDFESKILKEIVRRSKLTAFI